MIEGINIEYIKSRMQEMGYAYYSIRYRAIRIHSLSEVNLWAYNQYYFLSEHNVDVRIASDYGMYEFNNVTTNEITFEHSGTIHIQNKSPESILLFFYQTIPKTDYMI